ncbi:transcription regulator protein BACH1 isoform X1 [Oncorhynchus kisutch]|uniref:transcription regulator protein BACH1 isoform X1 n=1 Tax=Oncorhynchus kisutch TaxID=8019 RepID=UPI0012DDC091|nr:transcription regulator protein BACH1 isoform X1 [Oncorhynchus kisutch]
MTAACQVVTTMSLRGDRTSVFTFQSTVHSSHVLTRLNDQRLSDVLCDVTLVAGGRAFRAHCSVLASCSDYFHSRILNHTSPSLVLTLPDQVTAEGFEPLLQFCYTSKLLFTKDNIMAIHRCAGLLGFHNLETSCFDFLLPKFLEGSNITAQETRRRRREGCCQGRSQIRSSNQGRLPSGRSPGQRRSPSVDSAHCTGCQSQSRTPNQSMTPSQGLLPSGMTPSQGMLPSGSLAHNTDTNRDREQQVIPHPKNTGPSQTTGSDVRNIGSDVRAQCSTANPSGTMSHQSLTVPSDGNLQINFLSSSRCPKSLALLVNPVSSGREKFCLQTCGPNMSPLSLGGLPSSSGLGVGPILAMPCPGGVDRKPDPDAVFSDRDILGMEAAVCPMTMGEGSLRDCPLSCELPSHDDASPSDLIEATVGEMDDDQPVVGCLMAEEAGCNPGSCSTCPLRGSGVVEEAELQLPVLDLLAIHKSPNSENSEGESHGGCLMLPRPRRLGQVDQLPVLMQREDPGLDGSVAVEGHLPDSALTDPSLSDPTLCGLTPDGRGYGERSSVEREVAEHLAKGFWPDLYPSQTEPLPSLPNLDTMEHGGLGRVPNLDTMEHRGLGRVPNLDTMAHGGLGKATDFPWQLDLNSNPADCPFLRDLGTGDAEGMEEVGGVGEMGKVGQTGVMGGVEETGEAQTPGGNHSLSQSEMSPYMSSLNSGEDSDGDLDTDGDTEREANNRRAQEVRLPFPVVQISSVSRSAFQQLLRCQQLTHEQLEFVHDVRRRSKNRVAAQRCRKRKLEGISQLQTEIGTLRGEKKRLLEEQAHLQRNMEEMLQSLTGLCHSVCNEAGVCHEQDQLQLLSKLQSPDVSVSALLNTLASPSLPLSSPGLPLGLKPESLEPQPLPTPPAPAQP